MKTNMKRVTAMFLAATLMTVALPAAAQVKIATIRANDVVRESPQYRAAEERMKADFERRAAELQTEARGLEEDIRKFQQEADLLSPADRQRREQELTTRQADFGLKQRQFREDVGNRERELFEDMMEKIRETIESVARAKNLELVVQDPVFAIPSLDITEEVLTRLRAQR
jgi:outer membrane protein